MKKKLHRMDDVPAYRKWVKARDKALEELHTKSQLETSDELRRLLGQILLMSSAYYHQSKTTMHILGSHRPIDHLDQSIKIEFQRSTTRLFQILTKLKVNSFVLAKSSQAEIIAQLLRRKIEARLSKADVQKVILRDSLAGGPALHRLELYMDRLRRKILNAVQLSSLHAADAEEFLYDVIRSFPKRRVVKQPRRILKPKLMEADQSIGSGASVSIDNIDEDSWQSMLDDYLSDPTMQYRQPEYVVNLDITDPTVQKDGEQVWYAWEFEQDMMNEFVQSVRDGEIDAANDNGITDFVVIAIIDDNTCEGCCGEYGCVDFDGLLVSEVESMTDGQYSSAPYHFRCRCTCAPATSEIPEKPDDGGIEFDDWLMSS